MKFAQKLEEIKGKLFINGKFVDSQGGKLFDVINPADETVISQAVEGTDKDVETALQAARHAFDEGEWRKIDDSQRAKMMYKLADLIDENIEWLAYHQTLNSGKPLTATTYGQIPFLSSIYRYFAAECERVKGKVIPMSKPFIGMTKKEPVGVVAQIIPWNYPLLMMCWKVAPALAVGCTVVVKPAQQTPLTALMLCKLFNEAGFPPGVINVVSGFGPTGASLSQHRLVDKVSFTGSTQVGYLIMRNSHKHNLKPITLELGGKSANIICADADIDEACDQACIVFSNCGQCCIAGSRTFVHEAIYDKFVEKAKLKAEKIKVGDPMKQDTNEGCIISKEQFDKVMNYIDLGKKEGAKCVTGGVRVGQKGFFVAPTVFSDVQDNMTIAKEEIFGPVMSILKWKDQDDVIKRANSLPYGLGAGIMTNDISRVFKFTEQLKAGTVYVNCYNHVQANTPFGGYKDSGIGKDLGDEGLESYLVTKTIIIKPNN